MKKALAKPTPPHKIEPVEQQSYLPDLMDRFRAIIKCGAARSVEAAQFVVGFDPASKKERDRAERYVTYWLNFSNLPNRNGPGAEYALRIRDFCAAKTLEISADRELTAKYRESFAETETGKNQ